MAVGVPPPASIVDSGPCLDSYLACISLLVRGVTEVKNHGFTSLAALAYAVPPNADPVILNSLSLQTSSSANNLAVVKLPSS
eukprot:6348936-Amphidinium_carterae.1